jgi:predicted dehydrogenase
MKNVAILGIGFMGSMHAQAYKQLSNVSIVAIMDHDDKRASEAKKKLGLNIPVYPDLKALLRAEEVDVVDVCLPTDLHAEHAIMALKKGKHVICEKPLARTAQEAKKMVAAAANAKGFSMAAQCIRFWPEYQAFVEFVRSNKAGKLLSLTLQRRSARPLASSQNWMQNPERSGGAALDLHIHDTDFVHHLLGKPKSVTAAGTKDYAGYSHIFTKYEYDGIAVTAEGGWNYPAQWGFNMAFQALFENGAVEYDCAATPTISHVIGEEKRQPLPVIQPQAGESTTGEGNISSLGGYFNELKYFIDCVEKNQAPELATIAQAAESVMTTLDEIKSAETGKTVKL